MIRLAICFWLLTSAAWAADVDPSLCRDVDDTTRALVPADLHVWYKVDHAVKICPAYGKKHQFLWWIITLDWEVIGWEWDDDSTLFPLYPDGISRHREPRPYIIDSKGRELGRISDAFPSVGDPSRTDLLFSQWVDGFPRHIAVKIFDARAMGDYVAPPLQWNTKTKYYDQIGKGIYDMPPPMKQK
jgi:hypothetical protein